MNITQINSFNSLSFEIFEHNVEAGWWKKVDGKTVARNKGELLCLIHSEISEAMEGARKNLMDNHLPTYKMEYVELADAVIRILDLCGSENVPIGDIIYQKLEYNKHRSDHKPENRAKENGKKF